MSLRTLVLIAGLTIAVPTGAQVPVSADDLNRQELSRLAGMRPAATATAPPIGYTIAAPAIAPPPAFVAPPGYAGYQYPFADRYPFFWLNRYYGYPPPAAYEYINAGTAGYYAPVYGLLDWY